jgi:predicted metal-dependent hydrolase
MIVVKIDPVVDQLKRIKGSRLSMMIDKDARLLISAPYHTPISEINKFIESKRDWITKSKHKILAHKPVEKQYIDGEKFLYLGEYRALKIVPRNKFAIEYKDGLFLISDHCLPKAKEFLTALYKNLAWNCFAPKIYELAKKHNFKFANVKVSSANTKWGSCSNRGNINLSWKLVMAPPKTIDYVIIHELAHTVEANHSANFWAIVRKIMPDYEIHKKWLVDNAKECEI